MRVKSVEDVALEFLTNHIKLSRVIGDSGKPSQFNYALNNCDVFSLDLYHLNMLDGGQYIAVPRDGKEPFIEKGSTG